MVIATDGELYGHHLPFRELFLERLVQPLDRRRGARLRGRRRSRPPWTSPPAGPSGRSGSPSGHRGAATTASCAGAPTARARPTGAGRGRCAPRWSDSPRGIDTVTETRFAGLAGSPDPWAARDAYVDVVLGRRGGRRVRPPMAAAPAQVGGRPRRAAATFLALMEAQRWRLAMFSSDGWYWDDPMRPETAAVLRAAARAARIVDGLADAGLERRLVADLALFSSPGHRIDGATIYAARWPRSVSRRVEDPA